MLKVTSQRHTRRVTIFFAPVFFDWQGVAPKFFGMIHDALSNEFAVNVGDFSAFADGSLGKAVARYDIFGGQSNVTLLADRLTMDFLQLVPDDREMVETIAERVISAFRQTFASHEFTTVQIVVTDHGAISGETEVTDYLARYAIPSGGDSFGSERIECLPAARFRVSAADDKWHANCTLERSLILQNGLFLDLDMMFFSLNEVVDFQHWHNRHVSVRDGCMGLLRLEWE